MANSAIDTLLQVVAPPRASEALPRAGDGGLFGPALKQALGAGKPAVAPAPPNVPPDESEQSPVRDGSAGVEYESPYDANEDHVQAEAADEPTDEFRADEEVDADAVEISESAEVIAAASAQAPTPEILAKGAHDATLELPATPGERDVIEQETTEFAEAGQENAGDIASQPNKLAKPLLTADIEEAKLPSERSAKDRGERQDAATKLRAAKGVVKSTVLNATSTAADESTTKDANATANEDSKGAPATKAILVAESDGETDAYVVPHDLRRQGAESTALTTLAGTSAIAVDATEATLGEETRQSADIGGAKPTALVHFAPPIAPPFGSLGSASLDRLTAPRAIHPAAPSADADGNLPVDRARFIGRVEGAMRTAQQRDGRVQVRLSPPELGSLRIEIIMQHGVIHAKLEAETPTARNLLLDNLPALRERLAQQDMRVEKFDVDVRRDGGGSQSGGNGAQDRQTDQPGWRDGDRRDRHTPNRQASTVRTSSVAPPARISDAELDVRI
jgi:flagellar hook-length control protein FliK